MAELQSTDGSLFSRETDEEKSFESIEDEIGKETDKIGGTEKLAADVGNAESNKEDLTGAKRSHTDDDSKKKRSEADDKDKGSPSDVNDEVAKEQKKKNETKSHRNEPTLIAIEQYLKSGNCFSDALEYEEVVAFNSKIHRYAAERTRGRQGMYFREETIQKGDDANVKINPIILTEADITQERMYHQIYQKEEYYAVATKFLKTVIDGAHDEGGDDFDLDTKTANWLKRAAGMRRNYDPYEKDDNNHRKAAFSDDSDEGDGEAILGGAAGGNDRRMTRRRVQMTRKKRRQERMEKETESFRVLSEVALGLSKQMKIGRSKKLKYIADDDEGAKIVDAIPMEIDQSTSGQTFPSLETTGLTTIFSPLSRGDDGETELRVGEKDEPHKMGDRILLPVVARLGLEFRKRPVGLEDAVRTSDTELNEWVTDRARFRKSRKLINTLSNKRARCWAMHEFFYSDVDKEWYRDDGFASDLAKHDIPIDAQTRLTREEWCLIRRKLRPRPRLFSKRFIADQLKLRNRHRALVRSLQQDPKVPEFAPIAPGTTVNAFDKRSHEVRRGRVLLHDSGTHSYLVQFDDRDSGCDVCPDSEVAISPPQTNHDAPSQPALYTPNKGFSGSGRNGFMELVVAKGAASDGCMKGFERDLLISSIAVVTEAFERKKAILKALERCADSSTEGASNNCSQLLANLNRINTTLEEALSYLQVLYGRIYGSPTSHETTDTDIEKMKLHAKIPKSKEFEDLVASLISISNKVGANASPSSELLREDLSNSTSLLLLSNYLAETSSLLASSGIEKTTYSNAMNAALKILFDRFSENCLPQAKETFLVGKKLEQESRIEEELKDLRFAVEALRTEAALATDESRTFELSNAMV